MSCPEGRQGNFDFQMGDVMTNTPSEYRSMPSELSGLLQQTGIHSPSERAQLLKEAGLAHLTARIAVSGPEQLFVSDLITVLKGVTVNFLGSELSAREAIARVLQAKIQQGIQIEQHSNELYQQLSDQLTTVQMTMLNELLDVARRGWKQPGESLASVSFSKLK